MAWASNNENSFFPSALFPQHYPQQQCYSPFFSQHAGPPRPCQCSRWSFPCEGCAPGTRASWAVGSRLESQFQSPGAGASGVSVLPRAAAYCAGTHYQHVDLPPLFNQPAQFADAHPPLAARSAYFESGAPSGGGPAGDGAYLTRHARRPGTRGDYIKCGGISSSMEARPRDRCAEVEGWGGSTGSQLTVYDEWSTRVEVAFRSALAGTGETESLPTESARAHGNGRDAPNYHRGHTFDWGASRADCHGDGQQIQPHSAVFEGDNACAPARAERPSSHSASDTLGAAIEPAWVVFARNAFDENAAHCEQQKNANKRTPAPWTYSRMIDTIQQRFQHRVSESSLLSLKKGNTNVGAKKGPRPKDPEDQQAALKVWPPHCSAYVFACACAYACM